MQKIVTMNEMHVLLDTSEDDCLYNGHENEGPRQNRWLELCAHRLKSAGKLEEGAYPDPADYVFYLAHYSRWQGENNYIQELTQDEATAFCAENYDDINCHMGLLDESAFD